MTRTRTLGGIVTAGLVVAFVFAYTTQGSPPNTQIFATFATVQGAFVGIVFSIFVLASQVNATEFSPLTLEQLSKSRTLAGLLLYYTVAILSNVLLIQIYPLIPDTWAIPLIPRSWNIILGVGAGLTAISLLSLLIARQLLVQLTSPEQLLTQISQDVTAESLSTASESNTDSVINRPQRTPLLTIERILENADKQGDEYTVQIAIYEMHSAIINLLKNSELDFGSQENGNKSVLSAGEISILLDRWESCIEKGKSGSIRRQHLVAECHRELLITLMGNNEHELVEKNFQSITKLCKTVYQNGSTDSHLLYQYEPVFEASVNSEALSILRQIETELSAVNRCILNNIDTENFPTDQRELLSNIISTQTRHIATVATTDSINTPSSRTHIETILDQVNESLRECFTVLEDVENATASKQNILTDLHRELTNIIHKCAPCDDVITRQLLVAFFELSVELDRDHTEVIDTLFEAGNNKEEIKRQIKSLRRESVSPELTAVNVSAEDVNLILESIQNKGQDK